MIRDHLVGVWKLVASEFKRSDGEIAYPYGKNAVGMLIYDVSGNMSVQFMRPDRPFFVSGDLREGTPAEINAAFNGYVAYFGKYEVDAEEGTITHCIKGSLFPNWAGQNQKRFFELCDNRLTLKAVPIRAEGAMITSILVWEREAQKSRAY